MLVAAAVLPHPPLLVPAVAAGAAAQLDELRAACHKAVEAVLSAEVDGVLVVGAGPRRATFGPGARGTLSGFGVPMDVGVPGAPPSGEPVLPLSATIGCWLLADLVVPAPTRVEVVPEDAAPHDAVALGAELVAPAGRWALVVMGDGSSALTAKAPGYVVEGAAGWQAEVERMLATADVEGLAALSPTEASRFHAAGRAPWQVLAGAAADGTWQSTLLAAEAPYGVGYVVATWLRGTA